MGSVIIAVILFYIRSNGFPTFKGPGVIAQPTVSIPVEQIPNITQRLNQQAAGSYDPAGSTASSASYTGAF